MVFKIKKANYNKNPINPGEVIFMTKFNKKKNVKCVDGKYMEINGTEVFWIEDYVKKIECIEEKQKKKYLII